MRLAKAGPAAWCLACPRQLTTSPRPLTTYERSLASSMCGVELAGGSCGVSLGASAGGAERGRGGKCGAELVSACSLPPPPPPRQVIARVQQQLQHQQQLQEQEQQQCKREQRGLVAAVLVVTIVPGILTILAETTTAFCRLGRINWCNLAGGCVVVLAGLPVVYMLVVHRKAPPPVFQQAVLPLPVLV